MPLSIAMLSFHTCPLAAEEGKETGGMNVYVLELSTQLAKLGHTIDVFTRSQDLDNPKIVQVHDHLRVIHIPAGPEQPVPKKELRQYLPEFVKNVHGFIAKEKLNYDVLHSHYYLSGLAGIEINQHLSQPLPHLLTFHTLALMKNLVARTESEAENSDRIQAEFELVKTVDMIIAPSETEREYLHYLYKAEAQKITIIPPGVDTSLFKPMPKEAAKIHISADPNHKVILFVGRIEPLKGIDALLYALKIFKVRNPDSSACLWIVGGDVSQTKTSWSSELKKLEQLRRTLDLETSVHFVGQKHQHELPYYYNAADVVVMPSHYESFGMAALEALACGVPVITTNVTGISNILDDEHTALISTVNNPLLLASQMEAVLNCDDCDDLESNTLRQRVKGLDWKLVAQEITKRYHELT
ncbi:MAG TPA: glycosyltransferase [Vitreimonas sp.]|nr:glycosyltransferase [Vitreimonas sp.]